MKNKARGRLPIISKTPSRAAGLVNRRLASGPDDGVDTFRAADSIAGSIPGDAGHPGSPPPTCDRCPRLCGFLASHRPQWPDWHNAPVPSFGPPDAPILVVGLAPGLRGANRTGRPFTGDYAGDLLYATLLKYGLATGTFRARIDDGLTLSAVRVTNAVRCVPPENKPTGLEVRSCAPFLGAEIAAMPALRAIVCLGAVSHGAVLSVLGARKSAFPFAHGAVHRLADRGGRPLILADSYHCSRYNTNTGRLTESMFHAVFESLVRRLAIPPSTAAVSAGSNPAP